MGSLTTHVLDTAAGRPGSGIRGRLYALDGERRLVKEFVTNDDGRVEAPLLDEDGFSRGAYELVFDIGDYYASPADAEPHFLDDVIIRFNLTRDEHYHVPLLVSPWSYSTYRGS